LQVFRIDFAAVNLAIRLLVKRWELGTVTREPWPEVHPTSFTTLLQRQPKRYRGIVKLWVVIGTIVVQNEFLSINRIPKVIGYDTYKILKIVKNGLTLAKKR